MWLVIIGSHLNLTLSMRSSRNYSILHLRFWLFFLFFFFINWEARQHKPTTLLITKFALFSRSVYCSWDSQTSFFNKFFIKYESHRTIHTFKNYFSTVLSVFSKINCIQTDPKRMFRLEWKMKIISLFSLFLLLFIGLTALFGTIYGPHYTISTNFYLYLQYFQQ